MATSLQDSPNKKLDSFQKDELNQDEKRVLELIERKQPVTAETVAKKLQKRYHAIEGVIHDLETKDRIRKATYVKNRYGSKIPKYEKVEK